MMSRPCATPASGAWSAWTMSHPTQMKSRAARKGKWPPRGTGTTVLTVRVFFFSVFSISSARDTLEVRLGEQARLVKTVKIQVRLAAAQPGQDRRLPSVVTHSRRNKSILFLGNPRGL